MAERIISFTVQSVPDLRLKRRTPFVENSSDGFSGNDASVTSLERLCRVVICIAVVVASRVASEWKVDAIEVDHIGRETEKDILFSFLRRLRKPNAALVTFGGVDFDLPLVRLRAMTYRLGVTDPSESVYFEKNSPKVTDLSQLIRLPGTTHCATLDQMELLLGLDRKGKPLSASDVERYFRMHRIREIEQFEQHGVIDLYRIWLRHQLFVGSLTKQSFLASEKHLDQFIAATDIDSEAIGAGPEPFEAEDFSNEEQFLPTRAVA